MPLQSATYFWSTVKLSIDGKIMGMESAVYGLCLSCIECPRKKKKESSYFRQSDSCVKGKKTKASFLHYLAQMVGTSLQGRRKVHLLLEPQTVQHSQSLNLYFTIIKNYIPPAHLLDLTGKSPSSICETKKIQSQT